MTAPTRPIRPVRRRRFDLRTTALFFVLLALLLTLVGLAARTAAAAAERRPVWAVTLLVLGSAAMVACDRGRRRWSARRVVRRAAEALEEAAETAVDALGDPPVQTVRAVPAGVADPAPTPLADGLQRTLVIGTASTTDVMDTVNVMDTVDVMNTVDATDATDVMDYYEALDPDEFEQAIAGLCARDGCTDVEVVGGAGDLGADVTAFAPDGRRLVVQCKRYGEGHKVGSQDLQRFGGTCFTVHEADVAVVVTTQDFTAPAAEYARQCAIVCVDAELLRAWHSGAGPRPWELPAA
ncbi:restriction endonuclease [Streptomyces sp. NPDC006259]|uniref:restriction endonuclease n=1 Tax=Streptomyces sp. NPDC006259 TaxID=3364740 RepID=UPI003679E18D